jgi:hypothetical protein
MRAHREVLTPKQQSVLKLIARSASAHGFYLAGGTGLGLRLGHRRSVDFDWFCDARLGEPALLAAALNDDAIPFETTMMAEGTLYGTVKGIQTSFLQYPYARLRPLTRTREGCRLASLDDLACMKLSAIVDRGSKKDFIDVFALCREHRPLPDLLRMYQRRFRTADVGHVMVALSYFADADTTPMPGMIWPVAWPEVRKSLEKSVREAANSL